ncbi:MAG: aldo/keto reductase [Alphaproteobacteria bacterium]|nr:aldo/keto reductase [Alphaproteobacteria bacterium]
MTENEVLTLRRTHNLGTTGITVGGLAYGCWRLAGTNAKAAHEKIETALDVGMTLIDTADIYGSRWPEGFGEAESLLGQVLKAAPNLRDQMVLATKGGIVPGLPYRSGGDYLIRACEASLKRLGVEVIDLYQVHRPDLLAAPQEVARALTTLRESGKVREVGVSNYTPAQTRALQALLDFPLVSQQPEFSALQTAPISDGTLDLCMETGMAVMAWSPLAGGQLLAEQPDQKVAAPVIAVLNRLANAYDTDRASVALAFLMAHPAGVIPIIGTQTPSRIRAATAAFDVPLTRRDWYDILEANLGHAMP